MYLLAVLLYDDRSTSSSGVSSENDTPVELDSNNCGTSFFMRYWFDNFLIDQHLISNVTQVCTFD